MGQVQTETNFRAGGTTSGDKESLTRESTMKRNRVTADSGRMNHEEFAGFLRLWLNSPSRELRDSPEVNAYLRFAAEREPLSMISRRALGQTTERAA